MNMSLQYCLLIVFFALLCEFGTGEGYKSSRPHKYHPGKQWRRLRWHPYPRSSKNYRSKRIPPKEHYRRPDYYRYRDSGEDYSKRPNDAHPYTIVIQLPNRDEKRDYDRYHRNYDRDSLPVYFNDGDYIDDDEDLGARRFNLDDKKVRIKVTKGENPQLHIKISRADTQKNIEIIDKLNITAMDIPLEPTLSTNLTFFMQPSSDELFSAESAVSELEGLRKK